MVKKQALLAMHEPMWEKTFAYKLEEAGYAVTKAHSVDKMLEHMGVLPGSAADSSPTNAYQLYLMDANLGSAGVNTFEPASTIYEHIKSDAESGIVKFLSISGNPDLVDDAKEGSIPCISKTNTSGILDFIE